MTSSSSACPPARAFFLDAAPGQRFCLYHAPQPGQKCQGALIYIHPFAEEMNKSRRMAALQARAFTAIGFSVLQIDLYGCGDSSGDFADARWEIWKQDLAAAHNWLQQQTATPISLWGLRLGALLALDFAGDQQYQIHSMLLWQPIIRGELFLTQFLRLQLATEALSGQKETGTATSTLRAALASGKSLEIAGYELAPSLAAAIAGLDAEQLAPVSGTIHWFEFSTQPARPAPPAPLRVADIWKQKAVNLQMLQIHCPPFWLTQEIVECPMLLSASCDALGGKQP